MLFLKYSAVVIIAVAILVCLFEALKSGKPLKNIFLSFICGILAIAAVNLTKRFTGIHIPLNYWTVGSASLFGIPAVCGLLLLQIIFK